jgi:RNA polymerase sigma factor (sigma-70 family)
MQPLQEKDSFDDTPVAFLYDRYAHIILNYVARYTSSKEDADDLVLETFVAAMERPVWRSWSDGEQLAWLRRIAYNKAIDYLRRAKRHPSVALENATYLLDENDDRMPEHVAVRNENYAMLRIHLSHLTELQQDIVRLRFGHGLRSKEIAQMLNTSDSSVRTLLSRALNLLRTMYLQQEEV